METYKIKDLGKVITGKTPSTKNKNFWNSDDYPFVCPPDIKNVRFVTKTSKQLSTKGLQICKSIVLSNTSVLIDCIGADLGNVALTSTICITNQQINSITNINTSIVIPLYLYYLFSTKKQFFHTIGNNGSTMPIINKSMFENIEINIDELNRQQHIVNTISSLLLIFLLLYLLVPFPPLLI